MNATIDDWKNGWFGVHLGMTPAEIDRLILMLKQLRSDPEQHFHLSSDYAGDSGLGDIEIFVHDPAQPHNMRIGGVALGRGDEIPDPKA